MAKYVDLPRRGSHWIDGRSERNTYFCHRNVVPFSTFHIHNKNSVGRKSAYVLCINKKTLSLSIFPGHGVPARTRSHNLTQHVHTRLSHFTPANLWCTVDMGTRCHSQVSFPVRFSYPCLTSAPRFPPMSTSHLLSSVPAHSALITRISVLHYFPTFKEKELLQALR